MASRFRYVRRHLGPSWLVSEGESETVGYSLDLMRDGYVQRTELGLLARFPQNDPTGQSTPPDDALAAMARDRRVVRGLAESSPAFAVRLLRWLDDRKTTGNPYALMQKLAEYLGPLPMFRTVDVNGNWFTRNADGTTSALIDQGNWDWDGDHSGLHWSRFWVIIYPNGLWRQTLWGAFTRWGMTDHTWGSTATPNEVQTIRGIVADWKPAGTLCNNIILAFDSTLCDPTKPVDGPGLPDGTWNLLHHNSHGIERATRPSTALFWDGV